MPIPMPAAALTEVPAGAKLIGSRTAFEIAPAIAALDSAGSQTSGRKISTVFVLVSG